MAIEERAGDMRVLVAAPTRRDGEISRTLLEKEGIACEVSTQLRALANEISRGAGAILLTDLSLTQVDFKQISVALQKQERWSDLPVILLLSRGVLLPTVEKALASLTNVVLLERPSSIRSLISAVRAALRARARQYELRSHLDVIRAAQTRMKELQDQLEFALEASQLGTFHCVLPLRTIACNERCKQQLFLPADAELTFDLFYSTVHRDDRERVRRAVEDSIERNQPFHSDFRVVSPQGEVRWMRATGRTFTGANCKPVCFDGTMLDVTQERERVEERLQLLELERKARQQAEHTSRMKDEFLATLSHELRTPLNAIFGWSRLLKMGISDRKMVAKAVDVIDRNVHVQAQLIEDLLDMSRIISGKMRLDVQPIEISDVIAAAVEAIKPAIDAKEINLEKKVHPQAGTVSGDFGRLQQVLWNLLTNAAKFTPKGGHISVLAERVESHIEISVIDTGSGIDAKFLPHLFERFSQADGSTTRQHGGLGLGLSIVKQLVEMHGGSIHAESRGRNLGANFTIRLPVRATKASDRTHATQDSVGRAAEADPPVNLEGIRVLVVDDEVDARELISRVLLESHAVPSTVGSAAEGQAWLAEYKADVIVSDIGMPEVDGYQFLSRLRANGVKTPAIAVTAFARPEDRVRSLQAGYQAHLPKPVEPAELVALVARISNPTWEI